jgi:hypothetical protein
LDHQRDVLPLGDNLDAGLLFQRSDLFDCHLLVANKIPAVHDANAHDLGTGPCAHILHRHVFDQVTLHDDLFV